MRRSKRNVGGGTCCKRQRAEKVEGAQDEAEEIEEPLLEGQIFIDTALCIPLILKEILKCLNFDDLLSCSEVNRCWNFLSREILRERKSCVAAIEDGFEGSNVREFNVLVSEMINSPFSGLTISLWKRDRIHKLEMRSNDNNGSDGKEEDDSSDDSSSDSSSDDDLSSEDDNDGGGGGGQNNGGSTTTADEGDKSGEDGAAGESRENKSSPEDDKRFQAISAIVTQLDIKYLSFTCDLPGGGHWPHPMTYTCINDILKHVAPHLETFCVDLPDFITGSTLTKLFGLKLRKQWLPNVRTLEFFPSEEERFRVEDYGRLIKEMITAAPKLQNLYAEMNEELVGSILPLKVTPIVKEFDFYADIAFLKAMQKFASEEPKLKTFRFSTGLRTRWDRGHNLIDKWSTADQERVKWILKSLLATSQSSLEKFAVTHHDFILITSQWAIPVLKAVQHLRLSYNPKIDDQQSFCTLRKIEFSEFFPSLTEVTLDDTPNPMSGPYKFFINDVFKRQSNCYSCPTVRTLRFRLEKSGIVTKLNMCQRLFPNVKHLHLRIKEGPYATILQRLWTLWPEMETISISCMNVQSHNYDSVFLGIHKLEEDEIDEIEDFESLNIVPRKPSILNLKKLRKLSFKFSHTPYPRLCARDFTGEPVFISPLGGLCAFGRIPGLRVEIERETCIANDKCHLYLSHVKPFAKFVESIDTGINSI